MNYEDISFAESAGMLVLDRNYDRCVGLSQSAKNGQILSRAEATRWRDLAEELTPNQIDQLEEASHSRNGKDD